MLMMIPMNDDLVLQNIAICGRRHPTGRCLTTWPICIASLFMESTAASLSSVNHKKRCHLRFGGIPQVGVGPRGRFASPHYSWESTAASLSVNHEEGCASALCPNGRVIE
ncbi:hypothetical protein AVEN_246202-1 [Araneus ventricosus]|uniref:Uncharacterized protein n=1 Tax=Araneus ventricosus TaxID=182803 RepID=A0A4Y2S5V1_ARAVE|nr:hypothetical protein AVEN_246202-1 [Araneus ventricosus]